MPASRSPLEAWSFWPALGCALLPACREPTQVTFEIGTDARCTDVTQTSLHLAPFAELEQAPPSTLTGQCDATNGRIGSIVVVPGVDDDGAFAFRVVVGLNKTAADCERDGYKGGCIVARRALRFIPHTPLYVPLPMETVCRDVPCNATETCRRGQCVPAAITDPHQCAATPGCDVGAQPPDAGGFDAADGGSSGGSGGSAGSGGAAGAGAADAGGGAGSGGRDAAGAVCGDGLVEGAELCDDTNADPGDGCHGCSIEADWGCRGAPSVCTRVASVNVTEKNGDDFTSDELIQLFTKAAPDAESFLYLAVLAPPDNGIEYCLERADWYANLYLSHADGGHTENSGDWQKWYRQPDREWSPPDRAPKVNYFGIACQPGQSRAFCPEWQFGGHLLGLQPNWTGADEVFSNGWVSAQGAWPVVLRVGPTRPSVCGF